MKINSEKCNVCEGKGYISVRMIVQNIGDSTNEIEELTDNGPREYHYLLCPKCLGTGMVDWISRVTDSGRDNYPLLNETTKEVRKLIKENNLFGVTSFMRKDKK